MCRMCEAAQTWAPREADVVPRITISKTEIKLAERRARKEADPRFRTSKILYNVLSIASLALAIWAVSRVVVLIRGIPFGSIDVVLGAVERLAIGALSAATLCLVLSLGTFLSVSRGRFHRSTLLLGATLFAVVLSVGSALVGGVYWVGTLAYSFQHKTMPPPIVAASEATGRLMKATVVIFAPGKDGDPLSAAIGTGTVVDRRDGRVVVLTCSHVAMPYESPAAWRDPERSQALWLSFHHGRQVEGRVTWVAPPPLDLALVSAALEDPPEPVRVASNSSSVGPGDRLMFVPNPYRNGWLAHEGQLVRRRAHDTPAGRVELLETDLPVQPGDSGSGLFTIEGELVGVNTWRLDGPSGHGAVSLPSEVLAAVLSELPAASAGGM